MEGTDVADAEGGTYQNENEAREYAVSLKLTKEGKKKFAEATEANVGKQIAIVYDNAVLSAPTVQEAITGGQAEINGMGGRCRGSAESCILYPYRFFEPGT